MSMRNKRRAGQLCGTQLADKVMSDMVKLLLDRGADVNAKVKDGADAPVVACTER